MNETKKRLGQAPPEGAIKQLSDGAEYIPVGTLEELLDELFMSWETKDFRFSVFRTGNYWFCEGQITLVVSFEGEKKLFQSREMVGAATMQISSSDDNMNYSGTILSLALCNAAKRLGKHLGRGLNKRLERGETAVEKKKKGPEVDTTDELYRQTKAAILECTDRGEAEALIIARGFRFNLELKQLIDQTFKDKKEDNV